MDHWRGELGAKDKYLGIVEAEDEDEAVEATAEKPRARFGTTHDNGEQGRYDVEK
jgi:hypothetical protein